jgi:hypothetical protein
VLMATEGVRSTPRDLELVRFAGEMYGAPMSVVGLLLERFGDRTIAESSRPALARYHAARLERLGYAGRRRLLGRQWVIPTTAGMAAAGLPFEPWTPAPWKLEHVAMVARLRLHLEDHYPGAQWQSERWIRHRWHEDKIRGLRIPDGIVLLPSGAQVAVELELHRKMRDRYARMLRAVSPQVDEVWWFVPPADVDWLRGVIDSTHERPPTLHTVVAIPEEVMRP